MLSESALPIRPWGERARLRLVINIWECAMLEIALYVLIGAGLGIAAVLAYASTRPDTFRYARAIDIAAAPETIFPRINDLKRMSEWSPFEKMDPAMERVYSGPTSGPGQRYDWNGNSQIGQGWMVITDTCSPSKVGMQLNMVRPMRAENQVTFTLEPRGGDTRVTWMMQGKLALLHKVMHLFVNMDRMCGGEFEKGLQTLKAAVESDVAVRA